MSGGVPVGAVQVRCTPGPAIWAATRFVIGGFGGGGGALTVQVKPAGESLPSDVIVMYAVQKLTVAAGVPVVHPKPIL